MSSSTEDATRNPATAPPTQGPPPPASSSSSSTTTAAETASSQEAGSRGSEPANRSIVVDAAFFEEQFLRCQVCQERFHEAERPPKSLPCNHTFCVPCLTQIFNHAQPQSRRHLLWADDSLDGALKCPTCRVEIYVSRSKINDLPSDHRVIQMMDFLSQAVTTSQNVCTKHERQPLNFFCKKCLVPVCRDCTVLDHKEQQGHAIVDVKQALTDRSGEFHQIEEQCRQTLERMKARSDSLANASKRLDIVERSLRNEIKETFIEYRLLLEKRQEALTHSLTRHVKDQKALINTRFVHVCEHGTQLQKLFDAFSQAKASNDVEKLFQLHKKMKDQESEFNSVAAAEDNELFVSCAFESTSEGEFLSGISSLGDVSTKEDMTLKEPVSPGQLLYLDNEMRQERERMLQYAGCLPERHTIADLPDLADPDMDEDESIPYDNVGLQDLVERHRQHPLDEDTNLRMMLRNLRETQSRLAASSHPHYREEMEESDSPPDSYQVIAHHRPHGRRPRQPVAQVGEQPRTGYTGTSNSNRTGSRSRRSRSSREEAELLALRQMERQRVLFAEDSN